MDINVGVKALESGVVPKNLTMLTGFTSANQTVLAMAALLAKRDVLPHPPAPYKTKGLSASGSNM